MPYNAPGKRVKRTHAAAPAAALTHGQAVIAGGAVGVAAKSGVTLGRFVDPTTAAAKQIANGEEFTVFCSGVVELDRDDGLAAAQVGDLVYIDPTDNSVSVASAGGDVPFGVVDEVDTVRDIVRVDLDLWQAFLAIGGSSF